MTFSVGVNTKLNEDTRDKRIFQHLELVFALKDSDVFLLDVFATLRDIGSARVRDKDRALLLW